MRAFDEREWMTLATGFEVAALCLLVPTRELASALVTGELREAVDEVVRALGMPASVSEAAAELAEYESQDPEVVFHRLRQEHTRLFVGERGPLIVPYVGTWATMRKGGEGLLFVGKESMAIERTMHRCGVGKKLERGQSNDPLDSAGTVCEFLKYLCLVNARAIEVPHGAEVAPDEFERFVQAHCADYAEWFSEEVRKLSDEPLYAMAALLLRELVQQKDC